MTVDLVAKLRSLFQPEAPSLSLPVVERMPSRRRTLRCELFLTTGPGSIRLFRRGPIDEFEFFQRFSVSCDHDVEFLTRLDAEDEGTENYRAYGIFSLKGLWRRLPDLRRNRALGLRLQEKYGLDHLPHAAKMSPPSFVAGFNRLRAPESFKPLRKAKGRSLYLHDVLEILRRELTGPQRIAWIEEALPQPPPHSPVVHRYYIDGAKQAYLVRDHRAVGKRLYVARTSDEAETPCLESTRAHARRI